MSGQLQRMAHLWSDCESRKVVVMKQNIVWATWGFDGFARGACGNGEHYLYVSRAGVLQRIHENNLNGNGYADLVFCNS